MAASRPLGVILAGGLSRRMGGGDKALLDLGGRPVIAHVIARLAPQVDELIINANGQAARFAHLGLPVIADSITGFAGPLAGVLAGLDYAAERGIDHIVTAAADTPFFPQDLVDRLREAAKNDGQKIALAATPDTTRGVSRHPTFGLWPTDLRDQLRAELLAGLRKVVRWTDAIGCATAMFKVDERDPFFNINTPADKDAAVSMMTKGPV